MLINYPATDRKTLPIGLTKINVKSRQVFLADGTEEVMYSASPIDAARSILMYCDCSVALKLYLEGTVVHASTRFPTWSRFNVLFDLVEVTASKNTSVYMQVADTVDGVPQISQADYYEGNPFVSNTTVAVAGTKNTEAVYASLGRNARKGTLRHNGGTGVLLVEVSHNGIDFADAVPMGPGDVIEFDGDDIHTILVDANTNGTAYVLVLNPGV